MSDYSDSINSLNIQATGLDSSVTVQATASLVDANEVKTIRDGVPASTSVSDSTGGYDSLEPDEPDYLTARKIRVRKYQLKK